MSAPTKTPWWVTLVIVISMLPMLAFPTMLAMTPAGDDGALESFTKIMLWGYPAYVLVCGWAAWYAYYDRPWITWILVALMLLTHAAMWSLVLNPA